MTVVEPTREQVLEFCAHDPVERVFLEDVARRGLGRFAAVADGGGDAHGALSQRREPRSVGRRVRGVRGRSRSARRRG